MRTAALRTVGEALRLGGWSAANLSCEAVLERGSGLGAAAAAVDAMSGNLHQMCERNASPGEVRAYMSSFPVDRRLRPDGHGRIPLYYAAAYASAELVALLLESKSDEQTGTTDNRGFLPLHCAALTGQVENVRLLLAANPACASIPVGDMKGCLPLHCAMMGEGASVAMLDVLYDAFPSAVTSPDSDGGHAAHHAANNWRCTPELIERLYALSPSTFARPAFDNLTVLHLALTSSTREPKDNEAITNPLAALTTTLGDDAFDESNAEGPMPGKCEAMRAPQLALLKSKYGLPHGTPDMAALSAIPLKIIELCPELVRSKDTSDWTPLMVACAVIAPEAVVAALLDAWPEAAATPSKDSREETCCEGDLPLHLSVAGKDSDIRVVRRVLAANLDAVSVINEEGSAPLHIAAHKGASVELLELLCDAAPHLVSQGDSSDDLPLHLLVFPEEGGGEEEDEEEGEEEADDDSEHDDNQEEEEEEEEEEGEEEEEEGEEEEEAASDPAALPEASSSGAAGIGDSTSGAAALSKPKRMTKAEAKLAKRNAWLCEATKLLVAREPSAVAATNENGFTPLHFAVRSAAPLACIDAMLTANLAAASKLRTTRQAELPLHDACQHASPEVVARLLAAAPDTVSVEDVDGEAPLHYACRRLLKFGSRRTGRNHGVQGTIEVISTLLRLCPAAARVVETRKQRLPLHMACEYIGHAPHAVEIITMLLDAYPEGAACSSHVDEVAPAGKLPLHLLLQSAFSCMFSFVIDKDTNPQEGRAVVTLRLRSAFYAAIVGLARACPTVLESIVRVPPEVDHNNQARLVAGENNLLFPNQLMASFGQPPTRLGLLRAALNHLECDDLLDAPLAAVRAEAERRLLSASTMQQLSVELVKAQEAGVSAEVLAKAEERKAQLVAWESARSRLSEACEHASIEGLRAAIAHADKVGVPVGADEKARDKARSLLSSLEKDAEKQAEVEKRLATLGASSAVATPAEFLCPITKEVMSDPVMASDGMTYERSAIEGFMHAGSNRLSPITRERMTDQLFPNVSLRKLIRDHGMHTLQLAEAVATATAKQGSAAAAAAEPPTLARKQSSRAERLIAQGMAGVAAGLEAAGVPGVSRYTAAFETNGYDDWDDVLKYSAEELDELIQLVGMARGHANKLKRFIAKVQAASPIDRADLETVPEESAAAGASASGAGPSTQGPSTRSRKRPVSEIG